MDESSDLNKEYSTSYFNYHRNSLILFGLCSSIWLFNVQIDLESAAWIKSSNPIFNSIIPGIMWISAIYCSILFWAEWRIQSVAHFSAIGDDLKLLGGQLGGIEHRVQEYSENLESVKSEISKIRNITENSSQILLDNQRDIYNRYNSHFYGKISAALPMCESITHQLSIIDSEIDSIYKSHDDVEEFRKKFLLQQLGFVNEKYQELQSILSNITSDSAGYNEVIESPLQGQSIEFQKMSENFVTLSEKIGNVYVENESFANVISYFAKRSRSVKILLSIKVFLGGIGSVLGMFLVSVFAFLYHVFSLYF